MSHSKQSVMQVPKSNRSHFYSWAARSSLLVKVCALTLLWAISAPTFAKEDPIYTSLFSNKAVGGYDVVSYFQGDGVPVKGKKKYSMKHKGADWLFSSQENLDLFRATPEKYEPQYGGYCAYALALNETAKGDPLQYDITDGKLYLNINKKYKKIWAADKPDFISRGDKNWPTVLD